MIRKVDRVVLERLANLERATHVDCLGSGLLSTSDITGMLLSGHIQLSSLVGPGTGAT